MFGFPSDVFGVGSLHSKNRFDSQAEQFREGDSDQEPRDLVIFGVHAMIPKACLPGEPRQGDRRGFVMLHLPCAVRVRRCKIRVPKFPCQSAADRAFPRRIPLPAGLAQIVTKRLIYNKFLVFRMVLWSSKRVFSAAVSETRRRKLTGKDRNGRNE